MNTYLAPTYKRRFGEQWVLWYAKSNSYTVIDNNFKLSLDLYFDSKDIQEFKSYLDSKDSLDHQQVILAVENYLNDCNHIFDNTNYGNSNLDVSKRDISKSYIFKNIEFEINFDSELVLKTIHPSIAHLESLTNINPKVVFDLYLDNASLVLFKNKQLIIKVPQRDYHLLQGKFVMQLLCAIYDKAESDWIGTFHGCTIANNKSSVLLIGESGKGKSTLTTILASNGFELVADDVSPLLSENLSIYNNPSAISIKEGSFNLVNTLQTTFSSLPIIEFNKTKGKLKYIPFPASTKPSYKCNNIVMVNYKSDGENELKSIPKAEILKTLIPDSWISPNPNHAKQFLDWITSVNTYQITYKDTNFAIKNITKLLDKNI